MNDDTPTYTQGERKMIIILHRAVTEYRRDSVQSVVRLIAPRMDEAAIGRNMLTEWQEARYWWQRAISEEKRQALMIEYKFAAKVY